MSVDKSASGHVAGCPIYSWEAGGSGFPVPSADSCTCVKKGMTDREMCERLALAVFTLGSVVFVDTPAAAIRRRALDEYEAHRIAQGWHDSHPPFPKPRADRDKF